MRLIFFITILLVYFLANYYVVLRLWQMMPPTVIGRICLVAFAAIAVSSLFIFFLFNKEMPVGLASFFYKVGTSWFFILIYFVLIFVLKDLFSLSNRLFHFMSNETLVHYTKSNWITLGGIVGSIFLLMLFGYLKYESKVRVALPLQMEKNIGDSMTSDPLRIVAISDLHLGYSIDEKELEGWVNLVNQEHPDIVLIAGDVIDNSVRPLNQGYFAEAFRKLNAPLGVYACLGNHEYISGLLESIDFLSRSGIHVLRDSVAKVDDRFYVVGRDDRTNSNRKTLNELISGLDKSKPIILLDHQPFDLEEAENCGVDLQLSGHTHQGQVWPVSLITKLIYEKNHGYVKKGNTHIYVSSGIGLWGGKFRIGTQCEYVVIDINKMQ